MPERALSSGLPREYDSIASEIRPGPSPEWRCATVQKVSDQVALSKPASQLVANLSAALSSQSASIQFIVKADDLLTAFLSLERDAIGPKGANGNATR